MKQSTTYYLFIENNFDGSSIGTNKYIYMTELGMFGGKNFILSYFCLGGGALVFLVLLLFFLMYFVKLHRRNRDNEAFLKTLKF